jgi:hypothetical protein
MLVELNPKFVAGVQLPAAGQAIYWDNRLPGFGLVVTQAGHKSYVCRYRVNGAGGAVRQHRMTIADARVLSLDAARKEAKVIKAAVIRGGDPLAERHRMEASAGDTLQAVCEEFLIRQAGMKVTGEGRERRVTFAVSANGGGGAVLRTGAERYRTFKTLVFPKLGSREIGSIKRSEINRLLDRIEDENGPAMAAHTLAYLRRVFNWHAGRHDEFQSPIVRDMARGKGDARRRTLSEDELRAFWRTAEGWKDPQPSRAIRSRRCCGSSC